MKNVPLSVFFYGRGGVKFQKVYSSKKKNKILINKFRKHFKLGFELL